MRPFSLRLLPPARSAPTLGLLYLAVPLASRYALGWSHPFGYLSDLAIGAVLLLLTAHLEARHRLLGLPLMLGWALLYQANVELVGAVGRMPEPGDLAYLGDLQFLGQSTRGGGLGHPGLAIALAASLLVHLLLAPRPAGRSGRWWLAPLALLALHGLQQYRSPSEAEQWRQFNPLHKLLLEGGTARLQQARDWLQPGPAALPDVSALTRLDLAGTPLLARPGTARNVLIITLEGIPGAYLSGSREALHSGYSQVTMPRLSQWARRGMLTSDYVLHSHQTIRGLYAMLCGDYSKLDGGTPKGIELLDHPQRSRQCLPAQLRARGFTTHYLQGAGLRFMAKDRIMPRMGFEQTHGRDWFRNRPYLDFPWGMDDRAFFEGALAYVDRLRQGQRPWLLTLLSVGTHQPYAAPERYLARAASPRQAAVAYLDDALGDFLDSLARRGVLEDTLVLITSDESHGLEQVRLASAWGFNLLLAPERQQLPPLKRGVYGHVDLTASVLDYFALPAPPDIAGRSLLRDYPTGREIMSYTNGLLRWHDGQGVLTECDFQQVCRRYASPGFLAGPVRYLGLASGAAARLPGVRAARLDQSLHQDRSRQQYQFASGARIELKSEVGDDWADNLIGAQYLELPQGTRTQVSLRVRPLRLDRGGARLQLKTKEYDRDVALPIPELPPLQPGRPLELRFAFDNPRARKAFSFHLLGRGRGAIQITDFRVTSHPLPPRLLAARSAPDAPLQ